MLTFIEFILLQFQKNFIFSKRKVLKESLFLSYFSCIYTCILILFENEMFDFRKLHVLQAPDTDALNLVLSMPSQTLLAGCEDSCFGWKADNINKISR